jgi:hypothetical protein
MAGKRRWIREAFAGSHGQFKEKAQRAGMSTSEYAKRKAHAPGRLGKQARLALVGMGRDVPGPEKKSRAEKRYGD